LPARRADAQLGRAVADHASVDGALMRGERANVAERKPPDDETKQETLRQAGMQPQE
jgi:hypothetical protein